MRRILVPIVLLLAACAIAPENAGFAYLSRRGESLQTEHRLRYAVSATGMRVAGPTHRVDTFGGHPYEISMGALIGGYTAVLVHAERVADSSGASNYEHLPASSWPNAGFRTRRMCANLDADDIAGEHDLEWLRDNGFDPTGGLALEQLFDVTADHNDEVVITLAVRRVDCANEPAIDAALRSLRERVTVRRG